MATNRSELAAAVVIRALSLNDHFEGLGQQEFPHTYLGDVARLPQEIANVVLQRIQPLSVEGLNPAIEAAKERQLKRYGALLEQVHEVAEFLESSSVLSIPASFLLFLEDLLNPLISDAKIVLRADNDYGYSFQALARVINATLRDSKITPLLPEPLALLRFPAAEKDDSLMHTILGHELGHFLDEYRQLVPEVLQRADPALQPAVRSELATALNLDITRTSDVWILNNTMEILESWLAELVCDLIGIHFLGPAFAFSGLEFLGLSEDLNAGSVSHPPASIRLYAAQTELEHLNWLQELKNRNLWSEVPPYSPGSAKPIWPLDAITVEIFSQRMSEFLAPVSEVVREIFTGHDASVSEFLALEPEMRSYLSHKIPPAEMTRNGIVTSFDTRFILIAIWFFWREGTPEWGGDISDAYERRLLLGRLMLKALEIAKIRRDLKWP